MKRKSSTMIRMLIVSGLIFSAVACNHNPTLTTKTTTISLDEIVSQRAKTAFFNKEYKTAASLFGALATKGNAQAQYTLGYLYYHGKGVTQNIEQARHWFTKAAAQKNTKAIKALSKLTPLMHAK